MYGYFRIEDFRWFPVSALFMSDEQVVDAWNPLDNLDIAQQELNKTIVEEFESQDGIEFPEPGNPFDGAGVYGLYYYGDYERYEPISNDDGEYDLPIYVGKGVPEGTRKGGAHLSKSEGRRVYERIRKHYRNINDAENLELDDFRIKYLLTGSVWTRYAEQVLITYYRPWWNDLIDGFGDNDPGEGRDGQERSVWDELHPGRRWVGKHDLPRHKSHPDVWELEVADDWEEWSRDDVKSFKVLDSDPTLGDFGE